MPKNKKDNYHMLLWVILVAALGGGVPTFSKMALEVFPTFTFIFLRFVAASIILIPLFIKAKEKILKKDLWPIIFVSLFGTGNVVFFAFGVKETTATIAQVLYAAVPIIALITSFVILKTPFQKKKIFGVLIGFVGVLTIIFAPQFGDDSDGAGTFIGNLLVLTAVISYSLYTVFSKKTQKNYSPLMLTTMMVITTLVIQSILITSEVSQYNNTIDEITAKGILGILYVGIVGTALYFLLYQKIIKKANPVVASMTFYLQPIFSFIWAFFLLDERLTLGLVVGSFFAFLGAGLVTKKNVSGKINKKKLAS